MKTNNNTASLLKNHTTYYPTPSNISYFWNFGSLAGVCLVIQIVSGLFLSMHYSTDAAVAFDSVEYIMRNVHGGWFFRYVHANGASAFLLVLYIHIARGVFYRSYLAPRGYLWVSGVILFILVMATAFLGYVLPWGQMSFWGATVITNLATAIPFIGQDIAYWLWGGFSVDSATLNRFFSLHFVLPFIIAALTIVHIALLHSSGSSDPLDLGNKGDFISFYPYYVIKDVFGLSGFLIVATFLVFFKPNLLGHPDNYIKADPLVTPAHIVPEWYFLPFYAILRSVPSKLGGVAAMGSSIAIFLILPLKPFLKRPLSYYLAGAAIKYLQSIKRGALRIYYDRKFKRAYKSLETIQRYKRYSNKRCFKFFFSLWLASVVLLGVMGANPVEYPYINISTAAAVYYFFFILFFL